MLTSTPKEKHEKPVILSDGTVWEPYPPLLLKPPELRLSIEDIKSMQTRRTRSFPELPESNPDSRAKAVKLLESEPTRETAKSLLDKAHFDVLREIFILCSDRSAEMNIRIKAHRWLNQRISWFGTATLRSAALDEHQELVKLVMDSLWLADCRTGIFAPSDLLDYL
jgi:hypothetical protein